MKNLLNINKYLLLASILILLLPACDLEEEPYSIFTPETFYKTDFQVLSSLSGVYRNFANIPSMGHEYRCLELSADHVVVHAKIQGWWGGPAFEQLMEHTWDENHVYLNTFWNTLFATVGQTNALLSALESSELESATNARAELRVLRAYAYFYLMDLFGNVPVFTKAKVDNNDLPKQNTRSEVFDFVTEELIDALPDLPSQLSVGAEYYGRLTREAAYALLATVYLNSEVYTGVARYDLAEDYADLVIESGAYSLLPNYFDNFVYNNERNAEFIFGGIYTPNVSGGLGHPFVQKVLPGISGIPGTSKGLFGLPYTPQNGFGTRPSVVNAYETQDVRRTMFITPGPLLDPNTGDTVMVERIVPDHNSALYNPGTSKEGPVPYVIIPATGIRNQPMNAGIKWIKWGIDPETNAGSAGNDIAFLRYAEILLIKAEARARQEDLPGALPYVNEVRERSNASTLTALTSVDDILAERGRELAFEMKRRTDLIRFGKFGEAWEFKDAHSDTYRNLFPIPQPARDANPNLKQNPGYAGG